MPKIRVDMKGVHRVAKRLATGERIEYHYAWRGGPRFWDTRSGSRVGSMEYIDSYREVIAAHAVRPTAKGTFQEVIDKFIASSTFRNMGERTRKDHIKRIVHSQGIEATFGAAPIAAFEDKRIRQQAYEWRDRFSKGTGDNMMATLQRIVSYGYEVGCLGEHHLLRIKKQNKTNRAAVIWLPDEIELFTSSAPTYIGRILDVAVETGLRPADINRLSREHFEIRSDGSGRILLRTNKSNRSKFASVPITTRMMAILNSLPADQNRIIVGERGEPFTDSAKLGQLVSRWRNQLGIRRELRLNTARAKRAREQSEPASEASSRHF